MDLSRRTFAAALLLPIAGGRALAQGAPYPNHTVRVIVPAAAGGANGMVGHLLSEKLQTALGQPFIVENRGGGGGLIGVNLVAKAPADGYTLTLTYGGPVGSGLALFKTMPYDAFRDLTPVARVAAVELAMVTSTSYPLKTVREIVEYARANPGKLKAAINSYGSMGHLLTEQFRLDNNITLNSVPYKGSSQAMPDVVSGEVDILFDTVPGLQALIKGNRLRALAVATAARSEMLPEVPTFRELGMPRMEATTWYALLGPAGLPKAVVDKLSAETEKILKQPDVREQMAKQGIVPFFASPADTVAYMHSEADKWGAVVKASGMQPE